MHLRTYQKNITAYLSRALLALAFLVAPHSAFAFDVNNLNTVARDASKGFIAAFTLPLDFIVASAADYAHFTRGVGQTVAQNITDAAHASADLYRNVYTFTSTPLINTTTTLKQTLTDEVHTATMVAREGSMVLANTARDIADTTRDTLSNLSFPTTDFNTLTSVTNPFKNVGATATTLAHAVADTTTRTLDTMSAAVGDTITSATSLSHTLATRASDTIASMISSARDNFNRLSFSQKNFGGLALNTKNQTASIYGAVNEFWTDFLHTIFGPTETTTTISTPEPPTTPQAPTPPQIVVTPPSAPTTITRVTQPVIERTIERTRVLSGVTATDLESQISALRNELLNEIAKGKVTAVADNNALYLAMAPMNRINNLSSVTISNPTITGASITSGSLSGSFSGSVAGSTGSFDTLGIGTTTPSDTFAVNGVTYLASVTTPTVTTNRLYNNGGNLYWGGSVIGGGGVGSWTLNGSDVTWTTGNVGIGTTSPYAALSVVGNSVLGTVTSGVWNGTAINDTYLNLGTGAGQLSAADMLITDTGSFFTGITGNTNAVLQHVGQEIAERWSSGVVSGGTITTATGNTVNIAAGVGYIGSNRITWGASTGVAMTANGDNWISIDSTGAVRIDNTEPSIDNYIRLGYVYTTAANTVVGLAATTPSYAGNYESRNNNFVTKSIGAIVQSGNIVGTTSTPLNIQATSGVINSNLKEFTVSDVSTFTKWYNSADNGWVTDTADNLVNTTKYNVTTNNQATALVTMTASYWKKDLILRTLDGNLHYIYGQAEYATEQAAKDGALPSIPTAITNGGSAYLATAVVQNGDTTLTSRLYDIRPNLARVFGFGTSGTTGSIAAHSALSGLGADDHTQYLLASGARNMAGTLNMGTNAITGAMAITMAGLLQNTLTTEQMRLRYDASNYTSFTVGSTGALTIGTTGTGTTTLTNGVNVGSGNGYYVNGQRAVSGGSSAATSFGFSNTVSATGVAFGTLNTSSGVTSSAFGYNNTSSATFASAFGYNNQATSTNASAFGYLNNAGGTGSVAMGVSNGAYASQSVAIGRSITNTTATSLMIGPSDAAKMTILGASGTVGYVGIGTTSPYAKLSVVGSALADSFNATSSVGYQLGGTTLLTASPTLFNTFIGLGAGTSTTAGGGTNNTFVGYQSGQANTSGLNNTANGSSALYSNTTGSYNLAIGDSALYSNINGYFNVANGASALYSNISGYNNVANGASALYGNTVGNSNIAIGSDALSSNTTGSNNVANGVNALFGNTTGSNNVAIGDGALLVNTTGTSSVAVGANAGYVNTAGYQNTFLGMNAGNTDGTTATLATIFNATAIGYSAQVRQSNSLILGGTGTYAVKVGIGTTTPFSNLTVATGNIGAFNGALCADNGGLAKCYGSLTAGVVYGDSSSFVASDIAENYPAADASLEAGDIVMVATVLASEEQTKRAHDKEKLETLYKDEIPASIKETLSTSIEKATPEGGYRIIGVISTAPGVLLGDTTGLDLDTTFKPVALSGRVPLKVNNEGGEIKTGDPIALSSVPGIGAKATTTSRAFVGTALEDFSGTEGKILVFMNLSSARLDTKIAQGTIGKGQSSFWDIDDSTGRLKYIAALDLNDFDIVNVKAINAIGSKWSIDAFGRMVVEEVKTNKLCVGETCVDESMLKKILEKVGIFTSVPVDEPTPVSEPEPAPAPAPPVESIVESTVEQTPAAEPTPESTPAAEQPSESTPETPAPESAPVAIEPEPTPAVIEAPAEVPTPGPSPAEIIATPVEPASPDAPQL